MRFDRNLNIFLFPVNMRKTVTGRTAAAPGETVEYLGVFADRRQKPFLRLQTVAGNARGSRTQTHVGFAVSAG